MSTSILNTGNIIKKVYDPETESLNTNLTAIMPPGVIDVSINSTDDNITIGDPSGLNTLKINPDGSINVTVSAPDSVFSTKNIYNEVTSVASGILTVIASYTAAPNTKLLKVDFGGTNIAAYSVSVSGVVQGKKYTYFQSLNECVDFKEGLSVDDGDLIQISVIHTRPDLGNFSANILVKN